MQDAELEKNIIYAFTKPLTHTESMQSGEDHVDARC